jgi:cardiolipin synthase
MTAATRSTGPRRAGLRSALVRDRARLRGWRLDRLDGRGLSPVVFGNDVRLLNGGAIAYAAMLEALESARSSVAVEMYTWADDRVGRRFASACAARSRAGVQVFALLDSFGSLGSGAIAQTLAKSGVRVLWYHALAPWGRRWGWNRRNHRKLVLADGTVGFAGGMNLAEVYSAEFGGPDAWSDVGVRVQGPAVRELTRIFLLSWLAAGGSAEETSALVASPYDAGRAGVQVTGGRGLIARRRLRAAHLELLRMSREQVLIANAYFVPERPLVKALCRAARRGVRVRLLLPGVSDAAPARWAGRAFYGALLGAGVAIRELHETVLHAKAAVIDGEVLLTGSANLDYRSFRHNLEVTVAVHDQECARAATSALEQDWDRALPLRLDDWLDRPLFDKVLEALALAVRYWL